MIPYPLIINVLRGITLIGEYLIIVATGAHLISGMRYAYKYEEGWYLRYPLLNCAFASVAIKLFF